ncbi:MAG TPA: galactokinase, partial [Ktedonobacterales bacterium]
GMTHPALQAAREAYLAAFGAGASARATGEGALTLAWAPGRVNLIGEHTDYNEGWVLPVAVDRVTALAGRPRADGLARLYSSHHREMVTFALAGLTPETSAERGAALPGWARYPLGVVAEMQGAGHTLPGADIALAGDVPLGAGMSSSAALEVVTATFFAALARLTLEPLAVARFGQMAEHHAVGVRVGLLDQAASCLGRAGQAVLLDCRSLAYEYVPFDLPDVALVVCDTGVRRELAASAYNERRRQCEEAAALLGQAMLDEQAAQAVGAGPVLSLRDVSPEAFARHAGKLPETLRRRARHVISENERVLQATQALRAGDAQRFGALLYASHASLRDDYEVSSAELDAIVEIARQTPGVFGARLTGAGFGGCALALTRRDAVENLRAALARDYPARAGREATVYPCVVGDGPGSVTTK